MAASEDDLVAHFRIPLGAVVAGKGACAAVKATTAATELAGVLSAAGSSFAVVVDDAGMYTGGVSVFDLLARARVGRHLVTDALVDEDEHNAALAATLENDTVGDLVGSYSISGSNPEFRVSADAPTRSVFHRFAAGMHYQLVVPPEYAVKGDDGALPPIPADLCVLVEKKDVLAWARAHLSALASSEQLESDIVRMGLFYAYSPRIRASTRAADAFEALYNEKTDGIAIVDDNNRIVGNLSVSDAKVISAHNFTDLSLPVLDFLDRHNRLRDPVVCTKSTSFARIMDLFVDSSVSRLWVVDDDGALVGLCGMSRLMSLFFRL